MAYELHIVYKRDSSELETTAQLPYLQDALNLFEILDQVGYVVSWTLKEYSGTNFVQEELVAETGSNHPINAAAIFYSLYEEELDIEFQPVGINV